MTLHDRARKLAESLWDENEKTFGVRCAPSPEFVADAMVSLARDFAREAISYYQRETELGDRGKAEPIDWYLASAVVGVVTVEAAIAAAEKGESE